MVRFAVELAHATEDNAHVNASFLIAKDNELANQFGPHVAVHRAQLFGRSIGAMLELWRIWALRQNYRRVLEEVRPEIVVELMPHVWSPFIEDLPHKLGARRAVILHDWRAHPGDRTGFLTSWLNQTALRADVIVTLSGAVSEAVLAAHPQKRGRVRTLFHPDFSYARRAPPASGGLRVLFMGRLLPYKGLDLLVDAVEILRREGIAIEVGVFGEGDISHLRHRLAALGAEVVNRWLADADIEAALQKYDVLAATYREASQSGVVAAALGAGLPVVVTPVGGLPEQVQHGLGVVTESVDAAAIARAIKPLAIDRAMVSAMAERVQEGAPTRSMQTFLPQLIDAACTVGTRRGPSC